MLHMCGRNAGSRHQGRVLSLIGQGTESGSATCLCRYICRRHDADIEGIGVKHFTGLWGLLWHGWAFRWVAFIGSISILQR